MQAAGYSFHRRSIRLRGHDYASPGAYFVTIVTYRRANLFGVIVDGKMHLNSFGEIAYTEWFKTETLRPYVHVHSDAFVVMPNHVHGILWIDETNSCKGAASLRPYSDKRITLKKNVQPCSLGAIIRAYKSAVTYRINTMRISRHSAVWHRNYYEHIIRNQTDLDGITTYILTNPDQWLTAPEHTL